MKVPSGLKQSDKFTYIVEGGMFETVGGYYGTYSEKETSIPIGANYTIDCEPLIIGAAKMLKFTYMIQMERLQQHRFVSCR